MGAAAARLHNLYWSLGTVAFIVLGSYAVARAAQAVVRLRGGGLPVSRRAFWGYLFASPWLLGFVIFVLGPSLASLWYSFTDYRLGRDASWVGLENYRVLLGGLGAHGRRFAQAMHNSLYYAVVGVPLQIATSLAMALMVSRDLPGMRGFRLVFYVPVVLAGGPAVLLAWRYMLASNGGFVNTSLRAFADLAPPFEWAYRTALHAAEAFNAFFAGVARGDPLGPAGYALPAAVGLGTGLALLLRGRAPAPARRVAELAGLLVAVALAVRALAAEPVAPAAAPGAALLAAGLAALVRARRPRVALAVRAVVAAALAAVGVAALASALSASSGVGPGSLLPLASALLLLAPLLARAGRGRIDARSGSGATPGRRDGAALAGHREPAATAPRSERGSAWTRGSAAALAALLLLRLGRDLAGDPGALLDLLLLRPSFTTDLELLRAYPAAAPSPLWLFGLAGAVALLPAFAPARLLRPLLAAATALFALWTVGAVVDGVRYFRAFDVAAAGAAHHHFALFRQVLATFPGPDRVPLWTANALWSKPSLVLITAWSSGAGMLIFLAALKGVPRALYDAADVDGAGPLRRFWSVTLPMISPAMFYNVVVGLIAALQTFEAVYLIQNPQTESSLASAAYFLFVRTFRQLEIGQGSAASWILAALIVLLTALQFRYARWVHYEGSR